MKIKSLLKTISSCLLLTPAITLSQNLVLNGGFETYSSLPTGIAGYASATGWSNCNGTGSPDYLHLNGSGGAQLPMCTFGTIHPLFGSGIMGFACWYGAGSNFREYVSTNLTAPLTEGQNYTVSFYVSNGDSNLVYGGIGIDNFSVAFSTTPLIQTSNTPINISPQLTYNGFLYSNYWQLVSFNFTADSAYQYITLGNFADDNSTNTQTFQPASSNPTGYYYLDEISVAVSTGLNESTNGALSISENPLIENTIFTFPKTVVGEINFELFDASGRLQRNELIKITANNTFVFNRKSLASGIYFYKITTSKSESGFSGKLVLE